MKLCSENRISLIWIYFSMHKIKRVRIHVSNVSHFWEPCSPKRGAQFWLSLVEDLAQLDPGQRSLLAHIVNAPCNLRI